jgi:hypothetical protein
MVILIVLMGLSGTISMLLEEEEEEARFGWGSLSLLK